MRCKIYIVISIFLASFCSSCVPESKKILTTVEINCSDPVYQQIMDFEYAENEDSLNQYFSHDNPTYRYLVAKSFASIKKESALDSLYGLLDDPVLKVRAMAAYSIGQIASKSSENALLQAFRQKDTVSVDNIANAAILEALGKLGNKALPKLMISAQGYRDSDTLLLRGKMKSLFYFALRDIHNEEISSYLVEFLKTKNVDSEARIYAAHCLARSKNLNIESLKFQIAELFSEEKDKNVKMALALALRHTKDKEIQTILLNDLKTEKDNRVRVNTIKALINYSYIESAEIITEFIKSPDTHLALAACDFLYNVGIKEDINYYRQISRDSLPWQVRSQLLRAINKILPYYYSKTINSVRWQTQQLIKNEKDTLVISHYLQSLGHDPASYEWIIDFISENKNVTLQTAGIKTLGDILSDINFNGTFKSYSAFHRRKILDFLKTMLLTGDEGAIGMSADLIANPATQLYELVDSTQFLFDAKATLINPDHIESIHAIDKAVAQVRGLKKANLTEVAASKKVDWSLLNEIDNNTKAIIKTNKGSFTIELYLKNCPATVINFIELSNEGFYNNKIFHRVVPNFVIQTGSPRDDNYGGKDYVINSELATGYYNSGPFVGMASAGQNTESSQWFVTHSPTPHLDGKYTIFGKVTEGLDVIQNIQIGDKILDIIITNI